MKRFEYLPDVVTLRFFEEKCQNCGLCIEVCPQEVFLFNRGRVEVARRDGCMECGACQRNCPAGAIAVRAGVGCASAVINSFFGRKSACCSLEETANLENRYNCC